MSRISDSDVFSRSFMCLGFVAAGLIILVQWKDLSTRSATATPASAVPASEHSPLYNSLHNQIVIDLSDRQVYLYTDGKLVSRYDIAVGQAGWETPTGEFKVINKQVDPVWQHPFTGEVVGAGAGNPLGSRWIGFWTDGTHQIGLHGTNQENLIGQAVSHGCIRLREADIQALYDRISLDTPVTVRP